MQKKTQVVFLYLYLVLLSTSCTAYKNIPYFKDVPDSMAVSVKPILFEEPKIQYDDVLSITINTLEMASNTALNASSGSSLVLQQSAIGYRVDKLGYVEVALIGKIKAAGQTTTEIKNTIQEKLLEYYKSPVVDVKFVNFKVTILGEVAKPGTYPIPNEKLNLLDALGLAGDLTIFGKRNNVMLIRDSSDRKQIVRLNLNSKNVMTSPAFYLRQNDVLYIEPARSKADGIQLRYLSIGLSVLSVLTILASRIKLI